MSDQRLQVDEAKHKAFVEVDEKGTEAAAVTIVSIRETTAVRPRPVLFKMDRPSERGSGGLQIPLRPESWWG